MDIIAIIFDLDGTVVSSEKVYTEAFRTVLKNAGVDEKREIFHTGGIGVEENWVKFVENYNIKSDKHARDYASETHQEFLKHASEIELKSGFEEFAEELKNLGVYTALATSSVWEIADSVLTNLNIAKYFDVVSTGDEVSVKKPDPEMFITTAQKIGVEPANCVVFEDSTSGIQAAKNAGMRTVGIKGASGEYKKFSADMKIADYTEINFELLQSTMSSK